MYKAKFTVRYESHMKHIIGMKSPCRIVEFKLWW